MKKFVGYLINVCTQIFDYVFSTYKDQYAHNIKKNGIFIRIHLISIILISETIMPSDKKLISILSFGGRGDIQPFIAIGMSLHNTYDVRILSNAGHKDFVEGNGLTFVPCYPHDPEEQLRTNNKLRSAMVNGKLIIILNELDKTSKADGPFLFEKTIQELTNHPPDLFLVGSVGVYFEYYAKYILKLRVLPVYLQTIGYNINHAPLGLPNLPFGLHNYVLKLVLLQLYKSMKMFDKIASKTGKPRLDSKFKKKDFKRDIELQLNGTRKTKTIICQSSLFHKVLFPKSDINFYIYPGPCVLDVTNQINFQEDSYKAFGGAEIFQQVEDFFQKDTKRVPIYMGWGSMLGSSPEKMVLLAIQSLMKIGERGIILGGYANLSMQLLRASTNDPEILSYTEKNVLFVSKVSHEYLFPRVKCIIHHGGSGTIHTALRSGTPSIITPIFLDQFCHAYAINQLGVGFGFKKSLRKTSAKKLAAAIKSVLNNTTMLKRCEEVADYVRKEDGNQNILKEVSNILNDEI